MSLPKIVFVLATLLILISLLCTAVPARSASANRFPVQTVDQERIDAYIQSRMRAAHNSENDQSDTALENGIRQLAGVRLSQPAGQAYEYANENYSWRKPGRVTSGNGGTAYCWCNDEFHERVWPGLGHPPSAAGDQVRTQWDTSNFHSNMLLLPEEQIGVVILTNVNGSTNTAAINIPIEGVAALLLGHSLSPSVDQEIKAANSGWQGYVKVRIGPAALHRIARIERKSRHIFVSFAHFDAVTSDFDVALWACTARTPLPKPYALIYCEWQRPRR